MEAWCTEEEGFETDAKGEEMIIVFDDSTPEPHQWLDTPDGDGVFWFLQTPRSVPCVLQVDDTATSWPVCYRIGNDEDIDLKNLHGKWQRIQPPALPKETT